MNNLVLYANHFFDELEVFEDLYRGHNYKAYIRQSVSEFLLNETKETALLVYEAFFDSYRITLEGGKSSFIDLLDVLRGYEENAAVLIDKQRDHFIHSVNVFILGFCIYSQNACFRAAFDKAVMDKADYADSYDTRHEEFFYRWGLASLFHDVGYPVEIIGRQLSQFMDFAAGADGGINVRSHLEFDSFAKFNSVAEVMPKREFIRNYYEKYESCVYVDLLKPLDILAHKLHIALGIDLKETKASLDSLIDIMAGGGFIDHGYYSAIIVLKWYGALIQKCRYKPEYFFYPVADSASAILLHNYYRNVLMEPPFDKGMLKPEEHPVAWLLMFCDELQVWNREAYGKADKKRVHAAEADLDITGDYLEVTYTTSKGILPPDFAVNKEILLHRLLDIGLVFARGISIKCATNDQLAALTAEASQDAVRPRPLLDNLEKLAIAIHEMSNQKQQQRYPDRPLAYPHFADLPDTLKYSNLRQARDIADKLKLMGWEMRPQESGGRAINVISEDAVEFLAVHEHEEWVKERLSTGWAYGTQKNVEEKISPYLVPYRELNEDIKELDRDTVRNIPALLTMIDMGIFVREPVI